jgi:hypothetical protein
MTNINLHWLTPRKALEAPVTFRTPWSKGDLLPEQPVMLQDETGTEQAVQTKINAYWPDGSFKWLLHHATLKTDMNYKIVKGKLLVCDLLSRYSSLQTEPFP